MTKNKKWNMTKKGAYVKQKIVKLGNVRNFKIVKNKSKKISQNAALQRYKNTLIELKFS